MNELEIYVSQRLRDLIADLKSGDHGLTREAALDVASMRLVAEPAVPALVEVLLDTTSEDRQICGNQAKS